MNIEEKLNEIIDRYYDSDENYYSPYRHDENGNELEMQDEIKGYLESVNAVYNIDYTDGYSSCSYDNSFLAVAWWCDGEVKMTTVLLESY